MTRRSAVVAAIRSSQVMAIMRMPDASRVVPSAEALVQGGVTVLEVPMSVPGAAESIAELRYYREQIFVKPPSAS